MTDTYTVRSNLTHIGSFDTRAAAFATALDESDRYDDIVVIESGNRITHFAVHGGLYRATLMPARKAATL